jgi:hypothetical protein
MSTRQARRRENRRRRHAETRPTRRRLLAAGGLTAGATLAMAGAAQAETFTVGTIDDPGADVSDCTTATNTDCSLREAITEANDASGADNVVFRSGLSGTIDLTPDGQLEITEALAIQGPGATQITVDGGGNSRDFYVKTTHAG